FLPVEATLDGVIKLRSWLVQQRFMYIDGGFTVKGDDGEAYLSAYLDLKRWANDTRSRFHRDTPDYWRGWPPPLLPSNHSGRQDWRRASGSSCYGRPPGLPDPEAHRGAQQLHPCGTADHWFHQRDMGSHS